MAELYDPFGMMENIKDPIPHIPLPNVKQANRAVDEFFFPFHVKKKIVMPKLVIIVMKENNLNRFTAHHLLAVII